MNTAVKKTDRQQNCDLYEMLIYGKKKNIILYPLLVYFGLAAFLAGQTFFLAVFEGGEEPVEVLRDLFQVVNVVYLLFGLVVLTIPVLFVCILVTIGEERFLHTYWKMPEQTRKKLSKLRTRKLFLRGLGIYEADGYLLFRDRCLFGTPQIVKMEDIVWGYLGRSDFQYSNMGESVSAPVLLSFSLYFYTKDGRRHRIFAKKSSKEIVSWFTGRCPQAILGYGREQKRRAREIFRAEAERATFLFGEKKDPYSVRNKLTLMIMAGGIFLAVILLIIVFRN